MSQTLKLYETVAALDIIEGWLLENDGELTPEHEALLEQACHDFTDKCERTALKVKELQRAAEGAKEESKRLAALASSRERAADRLKAYLERNMKAANRPKVSGILVSLSLQKNAPSVVAPNWDEDELRNLASYMPQFVRHIPESFALNKEAIKQAAKAGEPIPDGVMLVQTESLRIR